jgi:fucose permease
MTNTKKTPTKQNKREAKATDKAKQKKQQPPKSASKRKLFLASILFAFLYLNNQ